MDALYRSSRLQSSTLPISLVALRRAVAFALLAMVTFAAALIVERRVAGALVEPLSSAALIALALSSVLAIAAARLLSPMSQPAVTILGAKAPRDWWIVLPPVAIAIAIWLPGSPIPGVAIFWLSIVAEEVWAWRQASRTQRVPHVQGPASQMTLESKTPHSGLHTPDAPAEWSDQTMSQRLSYGTTAEGAFIEGWFRAGFAAGQRVAIVHVAFCPAFESTPEVECEPLDGPDCEIRTTTVLPWGVRWEIKRRAPATGPGEAIIGFSAIARSSNRTNEDR